jgi:hypothetical protein
VLYALEVAHGHLQLALGDDGADDVRGGAAGLRGDRSKRGRHGPLRDEVYARGGRGGEGVCERVGRDEYVFVRHDFVYGRVSTKASEH